MLDYVSREPFLVARIDVAQRDRPSSIGKSKRAVMNLRERAIEAVQLLPQAPGELINAIRSIESIPALADMIASFMDLKAADKQEILATFDLKARLDRVLDPARAAHRGVEGVAPNRRKNARGLRRAAKRGRAARAAAPDSKGARRIRRLQIGDWRT